MNAVNDNWFYRLASRRNLLLAAAVFVLVILLGWCGVLNIASSQRLLPAAYRFADRQLVYLGVSAAVLLLAAAIPFRFYCKYSWQVCAAGFVMLVLLVFFGVRVNGMKGWFDLGWCYFQPSEVFKGVFLLGVSSILCSEFWMGKRFWVFLVYLLSWALAVAAQPDFGTLAVYVGGAMAIYYMADGKWKYLALGGGIFAILGGAMLNVHPYMASRIYNFFSGGDDYYNTLWHLKQFELAAAGGGWTGTKLGGTMWSSSYLPLAYNDSALATLAETLGVLGVTVYFLLLGAVLFLLYRLGTSIRSSAAKLFVFGTAVLLGWQSMLHIAVNAGLIPTTGLTLPFVSYGGSSLVGSALLVGMALSAAQSGVEESENI